MAFVDIGVRVQDQTPFVFLDINGLEVARLTEKQTAELVGALQRAGERASGMNRLAVIMQSKPGISEDERRAVMAEFLCFPETEAARIPATKQRGPHADKARRAQAAGRRTDGPPEDERM